MVRVGFEYEAPSMISVVAFGKFAVHPTLLEDVEVINLARTLSH
jgi:hypothetical protein